MGLPVASMSLSKSDIYDCLCMSMLRYCIIQYESLNKDSQLLTTVAIKT